MLGYLEISRQTVEVEVLGGKDALERYLVGLPLRPGFDGLRALGIVVDADDDASATLRSVTAHLASGQHLRADQTNDITHRYLVDGRLCRLGVFIAPDGQGPGALESLYLQAVGPGESIDCVRDFMRCMGDLVQFTTAAQRAKAEFHAWLSVCDEPGILPGYALDRNIIDRNSPAFGPIRQFLQDLAEAASQPGAESDGG